MSINNTTDKLRVLIKYRTENLLFLDLYTYVLFCMFYFNTKFFLKIKIKRLKKTRGAWVAQLDKHPTLAPIMIIWFVGLSPTSGSVLTAQSLDPASDSVSPSLSASFSLSQK